MATYLHPGVYVEEVGSLAHPPVRVEPESIQVPPGGSVLTAEQSTAAFLGYAEDGPFGAPVRVADQQEYEMLFGAGDGVLAAAVRGYFDNGGRACVVGRLAPGDITAALLGDYDRRSGLAGLETLDEVATVCVPDLGAAWRDERVSTDGLRAAQTSVVAHCELMRDRIAVLDPPRGLSPRQLHTWRTDSGIDSAFAVLPYPWIKVLGADGDHLHALPPSGHLAGSYARLDASRGFHRAPANDPLTGAVDLETHLTRGELDFLSPLGVNCLLTAPGRGVVSWGARTLSWDPDQRQLRRRRLLNVLTRTIRASLAWAAFEPAREEAKWARIADDLRGLLYLHWRAGALDGDSPEEGFAVRCDRDTNPPESVDAGQVRAEVRLAVDPPVTLVVVCAN
jgi:uncharacterized protein